MGLLVDHQAFYTPNNVMEGPLQQLEHYPKPVMIGRLLQQLEHYPKPVVIRGPIKQLEHDPKPVVIGGALQLLNYFHEDLPKVLWEEA